jgi:hypothetical protein
MTHGVECLPNKHEVIGLIPNTEQQTNKKVSNLSPGIKVMLNKSCFNSTHLSDLVKMQLRPATLSGIFVNGFNSM